MKYNGSEPPDDEITSRTRLVQDVERRSYDLESRLQRAEKTGKRVSWWVQAVGGALVALLVVAVKFGLYLSGIAHTDQMQAIENRQLVVETKLDMVLKHMEHQDEQMTAVAKTVKAPVLLPPETHLEPMQRLK